MDNNNDKEQPKITANEQSQENIESPLPLELSDDATILEQDQRYVDIKNQLFNKFVGDHGGNNYSEQCQDYYYGDPSNRRKRSLIVDTEKQFAEQYPDDLNKLKEQETNRAYDNIENDPAYQQMKKEVASRTNADSLIANSNINNHTEVWNRVYQREWIHALNDFVRKYPEKAKQYAEKNEEIAAAIEERQEREKKDEIAKLAREKENITQELTKTREEIEATTTQEEPPSVKSLNDKIEKLSGEKKSRQQELETQFLDDLESGFNSYSSLMGGDVPSAEFIQQNYEKIKTAFDKLPDSEKQEFSNLKNIKTITTEQRNAFLMLSDLSTKAEVPDLKQEISENDIVEIPDTSVEDAVEDQNTPEQNEYLQHKAKNAKTIDELVLTVENVNGIKGSQKFYSQQEMAQQLMQRMWEGKHVLPHITNTFGWRDKIDQLFRDNKPLLASLEQARKHITKEVSEAPNINDLFKKIKTFTGVITKDWKSYTSLELRNAIGYALNHPNEPDLERYRYITRDFGLRNKVKELIETKKLK